MTILPHDEVHEDGPQVLAPLRPGGACPIGWQPNALAPIFYGVREFDPASGAPMPLRIFFPSLDGAVWTAPILEGCGKYPLVVIYHGDCVDDTGEHYKDWFELPRRLAKSGYVVVVPQVPSIHTLPGGENHPALAGMTDILRWVRETWDTRRVLMPEATAVMGHSWGGLLAGQFAAGSNEVAAFASLSSGWEHENPALALELEKLTIPMLFVTGAQDPPSHLSNGLWESLHVPRHRAEFAPFDHWDYLPDGLPRCRNQSACSRLPAAAFDIVLMFLARYLPPEFAQDLPHRIPDSLTPPTPLSLTWEQEFYAGANWLAAVKLMDRESECRVSLDWKTPSTRIVPLVRFLTAAQANRLVRDQELLPRFTGSNTTGSWVFTQSPTPGTRVNVGATVTMRLRNGPTP